LGKVLLQYGPNMNLLDKQKLFEFLSKRSVRNLRSTSFYNSALKAFYQDAYDFILKHLDEAIGIQLYQDNAIRIYSDYYHSHWGYLDIYSRFHFGESIFFEDEAFCTDEMTTNMLESLKTFAEYNNIQSRIW